MKYQKRWRYAMCIYFCCLLTLRHVFSAISTDVSSNKTHSEYLQLFSAYWEWKRKSVEIVPKGAKDFVFQWFTAFYKIHEVINQDKIESSYSDVLL